jgi:predicted SnoaL-like aldol condensation-catalyzing enzyme
LHLGPASGRAEAAKQQLDVNWAAGSRWRHCASLKRTLPGRRPTVSDVDRNKQNVVEFYELAFNAKQPEQAVEKYVGPQYIQHNPQAPDGTEAFIGFVRGFAAQFPELSIEIKRVVGEGDIVVTHGLIKTSVEDRGTVAADFFRLQDGKIVEHWDVLQPFPETSANDHPMF